MNFQSFLSPALGAPNSTAKPVTPYSAPGPFMGGGFGTPQSTSTPNFTPPSFSSGSYQPNPYLGGMMDAVTRQFNNNLTQNVLPSINSGAVAAGGYGGARQGIAQGLGIQASQNGLADALANLGGNTYNADMNRALEGQGQQLNFFNAQGTQDIQRYLAGLQGFQVGSNAPWGALNNFGNVMQPYTGNSTTTQSQGGGAMGALGGGLGTWQLLQMLGK